MLISVICSSRRPYLWKNLYNLIHSDNIDYEIIFIGPFKPNFKLPKTCKFIHTIVKPSQCFEIGCRSAKGNYLILFADDMVSEQKKLLEIYFNFIKRQKNDLFLLSQQIESYGDKIVVPNKQYDNFIFPVAPVFSKRIFIEVGGIDSSFIAVMHDTDLYLRMMQFGCKLYFSGINFIEKERPLLEPTLYGDFSGYDLKYFEKVWRPNNKFNFKNKRKIKKFKSKNIFSISQGPKGKWKYKSLILFYLMQSNLKNKILKIVRLDFLIFMRIYSKNKKNFFVKKFSKFIKFLFY
tara:strand:+ start:7718 stop:8593 length:876 start_codon:yes stop_codon:yes gene_type:complete